MIQVLTQWCVRVHFTSDKAQPVEFIVYDNHLPNVHTHLAKMDYDKEVFRIEIWQRKADL